MGWMKLYSRDLKEPEMLKGFILSEKAAVTYHLCSETARYIFSGMEKKLEEATWKNGERR